nr:MAG TPA: hypothetical protein [Caudoviricetes sp.]
MVIFTRFQCGKFMKLLIHGRLNILKLMNLYLLNSLHHHLWVKYAEQTIIVCQHGWIFPHQLRKNLALPLN